jgi:hypothetical protein
LCSRFFFFNTHFANFNITTNGINRISVISKLGVPYEGETPTELAQKANLDWKVTTASTIYTVDGTEYESKKTRIITRLDKPEVELGRCGNDW